MAADNDTPGSADSLEQKAANALNGVMVMLLGAGAVGLGLTFLWSTASQGGLLALMGAWGLAGSAATSIVLGVHVIRSGLGMFRRKGVAVSRGEVG